jgi:hypothetical protein
VCCYVRVLTLRIYFCPFEALGLGVSVSSALHDRFGRFHVCGFVGFSSSPSLFSHLSHLADSQTDGRLVISGRIGA